VTACAHPTRTSRLTRVAELVLAATSLALFGYIVAVPTAAWAVPVPWKNCGSAGDPITIQRLDASVWPPQAGKPLTLSDAWNLTEPLTKESREVVTTTLPSGHVSDVRLRFQPPVALLFDEALLRRDDLRQGRMPLPIPAGPYNQSFTMDVPSGAGARAPLAVGLTGFDATGRQIVCMQVIIPIK
jgi:hypothetical protein